MIYCLIGWSNPLSFVGSFIIAHIFKFVNTTIFNFPQMLKQQEKPTLKSIRGRGKNRKIGGGFPVFLMGNDFRNWLKKGRSSNCNECSELQFERIDESLEELSSIRV